MGFLLAMVIWGLMAAGVYYAYEGLVERIPAISAAGSRIDSQFLLTLIITGIAFVLVQVVLGYFIFRYRDRGTGKVRYTHGNSAIEVGGVIVTGVTFVTLAIMGQFVWADVHLTSSPADAIRVEITAEQFLWNMRYPGKDGRFGKTSPRYYKSVGNTVGILPDDPQGKDDVIIQNNLVVPVNRPVELTLRSKDVIHSFFIPALRLKQDTMPGLAVPLRFTARETGEYEIACAELCGMAHFRMRGLMKVVTAEEYEAWLAQQQPVQM
ncbi:MAG: cytochrome c oxidase subunit II [Acidobacteriota bacterium]